MTAFYVYEHIRKDTGAVFYVGKGKGNRQNSLKDRNNHWHNLVKKSNGFVSKIVCVDESEEFVLFAEQERIDQHRRLGIKLVNMTDGGEGLSGYRHTEKSKAIMSKNRKLAGSHKHTAESIEKIRLANTGVKFTEERKKKISEKMKGRKMPSHVKDILSERMASFKHSDATKEHLRKINIERKHTPETLKKMSEWQIDRPKLICPHCGKASSAGMAKRWHFDKCKLKGNQNG